MLYTPEDACDSCLLCEGYPGLPDEFDVEAPLEMLLFWRPCSRGGAKTLFSSLRESGGCRRRASKLLGVDDLNVFWTSELSRVTGSGLMIMPGVRLVTVSSPESGSSALSDGSTVVVDIVDCSESTPSCCKLVCEVAVRSRRWSEVSPVSREVFCLAGKDGLSIGAALPRREDGADGNFLGVGMRRTGLSDP